MERQSKNSNILGNADDPPKSKAEVKDRERQKMVVLAGFVIVLVALAGIVALGSLRHQTPVSQCEGIIFAQSKYTCLSNLALATENLSICRDIPGSYSYGCLSAIAAGESNSLVCNYINSSSTSYSGCISQFETSKYNASICKNVENSSVTSSCFYTFADLGNFSNLSYCKYINNTQLSNECTDRFYYINAITAHNQNYCGALPNSSTNGIPISELLGLNASSILGIHLPQNASNYSLSSYEFLNISDQGLCYLNLAGITKNASLCSFVQGSLNSLCLASTKSTQNKPLSYSQILTVCGALPSSYSNICINQELISQASEYDNSTYCRYTTNATENSACLSSINSSSS